MFLLKFERLVCFCVSFCTATLSKPGSSACWEGCGGGGGGGGVITWSENLKESRAGYG